LFQATGVENLSVIPHGTVPPNPSELLMTAQFEALLKRLSKEFDMVLIDSPPILAVTDPAVIGKYCGTTLMVSRFNQNPLKEIEIAARRFEQNGIDVKGVIFNGVEKQASGYGYGAYGYYNYEYKSETKA
jgi:tyrosine-protein kinase Etk/Wzc